jgi:tetratricopeptide (TPR) repeat protein
VGGMRKAFEAADRAIALAPDQALGFASRGWLRYQFAWEWAGAQADYRRALELAPNEPLVLRGYATLISKLGRLDEAIAIEHRIIDVDPLSALEQANLAFYQIWGGDLPGARESLRRALAIDPATFIAHFALANLELLDRRPAEALAAFQAIQGDEPSPRGLRLTGVAMAQYSLGHEPEAKRALQEVVSSSAATNAYQIAEAFAWGRERDTAFQWLERAYQQRDAGLVILKVDPLMASLRDDARYEALLKKIKFPD